MKKINNLNNLLDHKKNLQMQNDQIKENIKNLCLELEQKNYMHRKIKFLLDIRGYLKLNNIKGNYVEFGSYRSEFQYAAYNVLEKTNVIDNYIGLDTFKGEPKLTERDKLSFPELSEHDFACSYEETKEFVDNNLGGKGVLIKGDFRNKEIIEKLNKYGNYNIVIVDCNLISSIESALCCAIPKIRKGGIVFLDDFYLNCSHGKLETENVFLDIIKRNKMTAHKHSFYPPFAASYIIF